MKALEKARSYILSDANTPVIGVWARVVMTIVGNKGYDRVYELTPYYGDVEVNLQYPNENPGDWMEAYAQIALPEFDFGRFSAWVERATTIADMLTPPLCAEQRVQPFVPNVLVLGEEMPLMAKACKT